jgi:hypothetical protein
MPSASDGTTSIWKERREWLVAILAVVTAAVTVGGFMMTRGSADSNKSLILVADKANDPDGALGLSFVFHPLNQAQKISSIAIVFPREISTALQTAVPLTHEIDLGVEAIRVENFVSTHYLRTQPASMAIWDGNIPVILEAEYVYADERLTHRGLYMLPTRIIWREVGKPYDVKFEDVVFKRSIEEGADYSQVLTAALAAEDEARRKLFNPTQ